MSLIKRFAFLLLPILVLHVFPGCEDPVSADGSSDDSKDVTTGDPSGDTVVVDVGGWGPDQIDSLFALLVQRVQRIESVESYSEYGLIDFESLRNGFQSYLAGKTCRTYKGQCRVYCFGGPVAQHKSQSRSSGRFDRRVCT